MDTKENKSKKVRRPITLAVSLGALAALTGLSISWNSIPIKQQDIRGTASIVNSDQKFKNSTAFIKKFDEKLSNICNPTDKYFLTAITNADYQSGGDSYKIKIKNLFGEYRTDLDMNLSYYYKKGCLNKSSSQNKIKSAFINSIKKVDSNIKYAPYEYHYNKEYDAFNSKMSFEYKKILYSFSSTDTLLRVSVDEPNKASNKGSFVNKDKIPKVFMENRERIFNNEPAMTVEEFYKRL